MGKLLLDRIALDGSTRLGRTAGLVLAMAVACVAGLVATGTAQAAPALGIASFSATQSTLQAGAHPDLTTSFTFTTDTVTNEEHNSVIDPTADAKDIDLELPAGLVGSGLATPQCPGGASDVCPTDTQVGVATIEFGGFFAAPFPFTVPVYNVAPSSGEPARFEFSVIGSVFVKLEMSVRTGGDYGITTSISNVSSAFTIVGVSVTLWGVPAEASHDAERTCANGASPCSSGAPEMPLLTNPTQCSTPVAARLNVDAYQTPGQFASASATPVQMTGCEALGFSPSLSVQPTVSSADSPAGLNVDLSVPQNGSPNGDATSNLRDASVSLPAGMTVNPSAATGLTGCTPAEIGIANASAPACPNSSQVGTTEIDSPLLAEPLVGGIYVAQQDANPFDSLLAVYVTGFADGVWVKLPGQITANPVTGQLTATFSNDPQLPFSNLKLDFFGGSGAILATPQQCGTYTTTSNLTPWSGGAAVSASDSFTIDSGCVSGFAPTFTAGTQNAQAGAFSPFSLSLARADTDQNLSGLSVQLPDGLLAKLAGVPECSEAELAAAAASTGTAEQANPSCPSGSQVGTVTAGSGTGSDPFFLSGQVYLTGPYKGAPYGLAIVIPALAGPYDLGTVVVRQALDINEHTAQVTDVSDPFPTILQGIPLDIRRVDVDLNRPGFTFNPTSCEPMAVTGSIDSTQGVSAAVSSRFQVANCASLPFKPTVTAETHAYHTRKTGSFLKVTIAAKEGEANLAKVRVTLPKKLPSELETLKQACAEAQFAANPAGCPKAAVVGTVVAHTPVLAKPLEGPAIYVAHGHAKYPDLALVLQSEGVTIVQEGATSISSRGFTTSSFNAIPDVPVSSIELTLPEGKNPALGGNSGNLCTTTVTRRMKTKVHGKTVYRKRHIEKKLTLQMPTTITGQNGVAVKETTAVAVRGCSALPTAKKAKEAKR